MKRVVHTPPSERNSNREETTMPKEVEIADLQQKLQQQERLIRQLQEQQQQVEQPPGRTPIITVPNDFNIGNDIYFSIRDALEAVPNFDGENITFSHFVEGCEEALSMISPS